MPEIILFIFAILYGILDSIHDKEMLENDEWHAIDWMIKFMVLFLLICCLFMARPDHRTLLDMVRVLLSMGTLFWISKDLTWCIQNYNCWFCVPVKGGWWDRKLKKWQYLIKGMLFILLIIWNLCLYLFNEKNKLFS